MFHVRTTRHAFTLIELLVVVAIIVILLAILIPSLGVAKERGRSTKCLANLSGIGKGLVIYSTDNDGFVVPSYNMAGYDITNMPGPVKDVIDGWAAILDRDGVIPSGSSQTTTIFYCPDTVNDAGKNDSPYDPINSPLGYFDWPAHFYGAAGDSGQAQDPPSGLPIAGFGDVNGQYINEIRCSYWLNASNPTGAASGAIVVPCTNYTQSVGYVGTNGTLTCVRALNFARPSALVVATDGIYSGRQSAAPKGTANCRIGYRHPGKSSSTVNTGTNAVFADGHAENVDTTQMPTTSPGTPNAAGIAANSGPISFYAYY